jgi:hypothetical protein
MTERPQILPRCITEEMLDLVDRAGWWQRFIGAIYVFGALVGFVLGGLVLLRTQGAAVLEAGTQAFSAAVTLVIGLALRTHGFIARVAVEGRTIAGMHAVLEAQRNLLIVGCFLVALFIVFVALAVMVPFLMR